MWEALLYSAQVLLSLKVSTYPSGLSMTAAASCEKLSGRKKETEKGRADGRARGRTKDERDEAKVDRALEDVRVVRRPLLRFVEERQNRDTTGKDDTTTMYSKPRPLAQG